MFLFQKKELTISRSDLTIDEAAMLEKLIRLGDSEELALWTIEHMERNKPSNTEIYELAYNS